MCIFTENSDLFMEEFFYLIEALLNFGQNNGSRVKLLLSYLTLIKEKNPFTCIIVNR